MSSPNHNVGGIPFHSHDDCQILGSTGRDRGKHTGLDLLGMEGTSSAKFSCFTRQSMADLSLSTSQAENADDWSYSRGLEGGWIPQDPTDRAYPSVCS